METVLKAFAASLSDCVEAPVKKARREVAEEVKDRKKRALERATDAKASLCDAIAHDTQHPLFFAGRSLEKILSKFFTFLKPYDRPDGRHAREAVEKLADFSRSSNLDKGDLIDLLEKRLKHFNAVALQSFPDDGASCRIDAFIDRLRDDLLKRGAPVVASQPVRPVLFFKRGEVVEIDDVEEEEGAAAEQAGGAGGGVVEAGAKEPDVMTTELEEELKEDLEAALFGGPAETGAEEPDVVMEEDPEEELQRRGVSGEESD
jgi:hypothetical protein